MNTIGPSTSVKALAAQALQASAKTADQKARRSVEDKYLDQVVADPSATALEKAVAGACRQSTMPRLYASSACNAHSAALKVLAAGVSGPMGATIATVGVKALAGAYNTEDARHMSSGWLDSIAANGTAAEQQLAKTARAATAIKLYHSTAVGAQKKALEQIARGVGTEEQALARFGLDAISAGYNQEDQRHVAFQVLAALQSTVLGKAAYACTQPKLYHPSCVHVQKKAFTFILNPPSADPGKQLAALGKEAIAGAYNTEDGRTMAGKILEQLAASAVGPVVGALAGATRAASARYLYHSSAAGTMKLAFERIAAGTGNDTAEMAIARLALQSKKVAYNEKDQRTLGGAFLDEIGTRTSDPRVQAMVRYAQTSSATTDAGVIAVQHDVLESIASGRMSIDLRISNTAGKFTVALPVVDPSADAAAQRGTLEDTVRHNRETVTRAREVEKTSTASLAVLQNEATELAKRQAELEAAAKGPKATVHRHWHTANTLGLIGAIAGGAAVVATGGALAAIGVSAVGAAVFGVSQWLISTRSRERRRLMAEVDDTLIKEALKRVELSGMRSRIADAQKVTGEAQKAIAEADKSLQVFRMADAVNKPIAEGGLEIEESAVTIGGIRIPRRPAQPTPEDASAPPSDGQAGTAPTGSTSGGTAERAAD